MKLVLLHSPLVGPGTWSLVAPALRARGYDVVVPDLASAMQQDGPYYPALASLVRSGLNTYAPVTFVAHSGAGALIPAAAQGLDARAIFVDALLPHPGQSWFDTAPTRLNAHLQNLAQNGRVPPWHRWWPKGAVEALLGDRFFTFASELCDLPLAYFSETLPPAPELPPQRCSYLQLSDANGAEAEIARSRGWHTQTLAHNHLAMLTHPSEVCAALDAAVENLAA